MSNAAKHRKKAAEFEQLKQIDRAIAMYIKAIDEGEADGEEIDVALLNKVGDLTMRQGRVADAVTYYERAVEHYATAGLFNNAIALCNKILRSAPGRSNVYFTLGRICAKKGLRGDATRNFLEYATRMQQDGRIDEGMRALAEVADLMPELTEVRRLVDEHAARAGITIPRRQTPVVAAAAIPETPGFRRDKSSELVFLDIDSPIASRRNTPPLSPRVSGPLNAISAQGAGKPTARATPSRGANGAGDRSPSKNMGPVSLDAFLLFDPTRPGAVTPPEAQRAVAVQPSPKPDEAAPAPTTVVPSATASEASIEAVADHVRELSVAAPVPEAAAQPTALPVELELRELDEPAVGVPLEPVPQSAVAPAGESAVAPR